jgi:hypothetical protein
MARKRQGSGMARRRSVPQGERRATQSSAAPLSLRKPIRGRNGSRCANQGHSGGENCDTSRQIAAIKHGHQPAE